MSSHLSGSLAALPPNAAPQFPAGSCLEDLWLKLNTVTENSIDRVELVVPDGAPSAGANIFGKTAWINQWPPGLRAEAASMLENAKRSGCTRKTFGIENAGGAQIYWDIVLTQVKGHDAVISAARDITAHMLQEQQLRRVAYYDSLTGLLNRAALRERLAQRIEAASCNGETVALLMLDLDNFKMINDTLGHDAGDAVLIEAAQRLQNALPESADAGRLGGDEFAVIARLPGGKLALFSLAESLLEVMRRPISFKGRILDTRASIGVALFPNHGVDPAQLLKNADIALYAAKSFGRGGFTLYVAAMGNALRSRAAGIDAVRDAISQHRLEAFYQPKIELSTRKVCGFEALLRLRDAQGALIPAQAIRHAFEDFDLARLIGDRMFDRVAFDMRVWREAGIPVQRIALNAAAVEFRAGDFAPRLLGKLQRAELAPEMFEIEVAETVLAGRGTGYVATSLMDLAKAGVRVTLDNFGTGAASLAQLKHLPLNAIKMDRSFVASLEDGIEDYTLVRAIIGIADGLGFGMAAAGIESEGQLTTLQSLGCKSGQGDLLGPAISGAEIANAAPEPTSS